MQSIKLYFADGDNTDTRVNGTDEEIVNHYEENNFLEKDSSKRVIYIGFYDTGKIIKLSRGR